MHTIDFISWKATFLVSRLDLHKKLRSVIVNENSFKIHSCILTLEWRSIAVLIKTRKINEMY